MYKQIICEVSSVYSPHHHHRHRHQCHHHDHLTKWLPGIYPVQSRPTLSLPITWIFPSPFTSLYLSPLPHFQTIPPQYSTLLSSFTVVTFSHFLNLFLFHWISAFHFTLPRTRRSLKERCGVKHIYPPESEVVFALRFCLLMLRLSVCVCADIEVLSVFLLRLRFSWDCEPRCWVWLWVCLDRGALKVDIGIVSHSCKRRKN